MAASTIQQRALHQFLAHQALEQKVRAGNIGRASIAKEKPEALAPFRLDLAHNNAAPAGLKQTHSQHLAPLHTQHTQIKKIHTGEASLSGNTIDPEQEMMKLNESITQSYAAQQAIKNTNARLSLAYSFTGR